MLILLTYDVSTQEKAGQRRLRRVAKTCERFGIRVQKSVFECQVGSTELVELRSALAKLIKLDEDSLRIYFFDEWSRSRTEHYGIGAPPDLERDTLMV
jgi:CRISPR-associated protein Cas2